MKSSPELAAKVSRKLQNLVAQDYAELTQQEISDRIGISIMVWNYALRGKSTPTLPALKMIAEFFNVSLDWLCDHRVKAKKPTATTGGRKVPA